ncbi:MAG: transposase [Candidatus Cloacimonetes bacterium]|nr:transposase [Candidatus Cloacimonadota bacterium]
MQCKKEEYVEGNIFHFYNRTASGKLLYRCDDDYLYFLDKFRSNNEKYPCEVYAYCLMPNHFHFCLKQNSDQPLYRIFNDTLTSYCMHYNAKYKLVGHLMAGKLQSRRITERSYVLQVCRYIHYNPVKAGLVEHIEDWSFSNYLEIIGKRKGSLYSKELIDDYPEEFLDYEKNIKMYEAYVKDTGFIDILFDEG